ncbi:MAG: ABC-F family ATP-binding cassette domain-containing protein [Actinomycetota bacterium]
MVTQSTESSFSVTLRDVSISRADRPVLYRVNLTVSDRSRSAIVGPNGVGKSTLLRVLAGRLKPDRGTVTASPPTASVGLLDQELPVDGAATVRELIAGRLGIVAAEAELTAAAAGLTDDQSGSERPGVEQSDTEREAITVDIGLTDTANEPSPWATGHPPNGAVVGPADRYDRALQRYLAIGAADFPARLAEMAERLGLTDRHLVADPTTLSGGEAERVGLAMIMLSRFDLTLLDEPTNNLDLHGLAMLEDWVDRHRGGLIVVSHDRAFLERSIRSVIEIDHHHHTVTEFGGGWQAFLDERQRAADLAQERYRTYTEQRDRLAARAQTQMEWADGGASRARKNPADGDKFRRNWAIAQTESLAGRAKATKRAMDRLETVEKPWEPWELRFTIGNAARSADRVIVADGLTLRRGAFTLGPLNLDVRFGDRLAIAGANGSGKTTLIDLILGRLAPTDGIVRLGPGVVVGELGQRRDGFFADGFEVGRSDAAGAVTDAAGPDLLRAFQSGSGLAVSEARSMLAKFGLDAEAVSRPATSLSPGERTRARLALFQAIGVNLLVLDEPTNHLDLEAIEQLESALDRYVGTLILISHDRRLIERVRLTRTVELVNGLVREP